MSTPAFLGAADIKNDLEHEVQVNTKTARRTTAKKAWAREVGANPLNQLAGFALLGGAAYALYRWWDRRRHSSSSEHGSQQVDQQGRKAGEKGYASAFSFDKKKRKWQSGNQDAGSSLKDEEPFSAVQAIPMRSLPQPAPRDPGRPKGVNPKKNKNKKKDGKKGNEQKEDPMIASVIAQRAKAKGIAEAGKDIDTGLVTTMNYEKTNDAFHHVVDWQETGKKGFRK